jgi:hypothetical protein
MAEATSRVAEARRRVPVWFGRGRLGRDFGGRWSHLARPDTTHAPRPTVLLEEPRTLRAYAHWRQLSDAGYAPRWCPGPGARHGGCPLVACGRCHLVEQADVVVCALDRTRPSARDVVAALRRLHPDRPLVLPGAEPGAPSTGDDARTTTLAGTGTMVDWVSSALAVEGGPRQRPRLR